MSYNAHHLIKLWPNLNAAGESTILIIGWTCSLEDSCLGRGLSVQLAEEWIRNHHLALAATHAHWVVIVWNLVRGESVLGITTLAIWENACSLISLKNIEEWLSWHSSISPWNTIWWQNIDPYNLISHFDSTSFLGGAQGVGAELLHS